MTAIRREIVEETGYTDIGDPTFVLTTCYHAFRHNKDKNVK